MTNMYEIPTQRYGREDPREYFADPNKSPRTMDNYGARSFQDIWVMTIKRSVGIWMTIMITSAVLLFIPALILGFEVYGSWVIGMMFITSVIVFYQAPMFWNTARAYYKPELYEEYGANW